MFILFKKHGIRDPSGDEAMSCLKKVNSVSGNIIAVQFREEFFREKDPETVTIKKKVFLKSLPFGHVFNFKMVMVLCAIFFLMEAKPAGNAYSMAVNNYTIVEKSEPVNLIKIAGSSSIDNDIDVGFFIEPDMMSVDNISRHHYHFIGQERVLTDSIIVPFDRISVSFDVARAIADASKEFDIDLSYMMAVAERESLFDPNARAPTSSATGLYQFIDSTWLSSMKAFGPYLGYEDEAALITRIGNTFVVEDKAERKRILDMRFDPVLSARMAAMLALSDRKALSSSLSRRIETSEMYISHFLGRRGAERLLRASNRNPRASAARMFSRAARANRSVFYDRRGRGRAFTVAQLHSNLKTSIENRMKRFEDAAVLIAMTGRENGIVLAYAN